MKKSAMIDKDRFQKLLLEWYGREARDLPWRSDPSPYRTWISEMMLQQTRIDTALPYFNRFMEEVPDIPTLAAIDEERLMKLWQGLGYYNRARNLKKAAEIIIREHGGELPDEFQDLKALPGIGDYSGGAIASIAFGRRVPAVDGNVLRVFARIMGDRRDISGSEFKKEVMALVTELLPCERVGDFNQALMELGALICLPNGEPRCSFCPVRELCRAFALNLTSAIPFKAAPKKRRVERKTILLIEKEGRYALRKREDSGLLRGLWEFPNAEGALGEEECRKELGRLGIVPKDIRPLPSSRHIFSHVEWLMEGYAVQAVPEGGPGPLVWAAPEELLEVYSIPSAFRDYLKWIGGLHARSVKSL